MAEAVAHAAPPAARGRGPGLVRALLAEPKVVVGGGFILLLIVLAIAAPLIAPHDPLAQDLMLEKLPPAGLAGAEPGYLLGTDGLGRDVLSRLIYGSQTALIVGFGAAFVGATAGAVLGVGSAYFGGRLDLIVQRFMDIFISFPLIILALAMVAILGNSLPNVIAAITIPMIPRCALVIRASALSVREMPYVDAARPAGFGHSRIVTRGKPNVASA